MSAPAPSPLAIVDAEPLPRQEEVLTDAALAFVAELHRRFTPRRDELLARRAERRAEIARTSTLDFLPETAAIRADDSWTVAPAPAALEDRRVEITGPTDRRMTVNALNSGARVWLADFEDASAPTWEPRLWNDVFVFAQDYTGIPQGTIRATVLIETITAAYEMEEILYELRDHASGLNAGRWDYLFSIVKNFRDAGPLFVLPDRNAVTMTAPFMRAYTELLVATCHKRGAFAIGGVG